MDGKKNKVSVHIFGDVYAIKGELNAERIYHLAQLVDDQMHRIAHSQSRLSTEKIAVLAALNIADEYLRLEQDYKQLMALVKEQG